MKKCPWCGATYPDEISICASDQNKLEACETTPADASKSEENPSDLGETAPIDAAEVEENAPDPDGFRSVGRFDPFDARDLLKKFEDAGLRFEVDMIEGKTPSGRGLRKSDWINIYVHMDDEEKANAIIRKDWKV